MTRHHVARATATAPVELHHVGRADVVDAGDLTLVACIVPWGVAARVTDDGRTFYDESWSPGSLVPEDRVPLFDGHVPAGGGPGMLNPDRLLIGRANSFEERPDGLYATLTLMNTPEGRRAYEAARVMGYVDVSLEADVPLGASGTVARTAAAPAPLTGVAVVLPPGRGAYRGALATAARADTPQEPDPDDPDDDEAADPADPEPGEDATAGRAGVAEIVRRELARYGGAPAQRRTPVGGPLARYSSFGELVEAARSRRPDANAEISQAFATCYRAWTDRRRLSQIVGRALADQLTTDNPGVMPPTWLSEVFGIVDEGRPGITAFGGPRSAGDSGMDIYWPFYDGDLHTIVAEQTVEKTAITSVKVSFKRGQATLRTFAGGSDVSFQLQRRSSPSYMALYDRILQMAYGVTTEHEFDEVLVAAGTAGPPYDMGVDTDGSGLRAVLFEASAAVKRATGRPATAALASPAVYAALGGQAWLQAPQYGTQNVAGTASASTLSINVSGLEVTEAHGLATNVLIVSNDQGAAWFEDGPFIVTAEDVEKLGTNVAIWGMGEAGVFLPAAVVKIAVTLPVAAAASSGRSSRS